MNRKRVYLSSCNYHIRTIDVTAICKSIMKDNISTVILNAFPSCSFKLVIKLPGI